ncbi:MAG: Stk1 family PASTA domain-containing Ser/Thr kinase [Eggerthellaceae bacterium]|nr:Stk1 family PASTA domain-containing Ser/Thr kinase [Eggerthellaceae bacterium]
MTGRTLGNRYLVGERIGIGGMAEVYQGQDTVLGRTVAIKIMLPQYAEDENFRTRFRQEAAAAANLQSPYIVNVYDWGQDADTSFIVMEFVRGSDLKTAIQQRGAINQRKVAEIGSQVCQALAVAHNLDIIHRDIKPQNIMVQPDGNVKVMDFGIARAKNSVMAKTSAVLGTAHYISPEQAQGKELTAASDIYSLGIVLYEAATGQLPFDGPDAVSVALKQVQDQATPPREINPSLDLALESIIMKAIAKNPRDRFATARDMRRALNDYLAGRPVNIVGLNAAETMAINDAIPDIPPVPFNTEKTSVMTTPVNTVHQPSGRIIMTEGNGGAGNSGGGSGKTRRGLLIGLVALVAIAAIAAISYFLLSSTANQGAEVPDCAGMTLNEATAAIEDAGFKVGNIDYAFNDTVPADAIISQSPRAGTKQTKDTPINFVVSKGIEQVEVPDLTNMTANEARAALQRAGLKFEAGTAEHSDTVKENRVMRQEPAAGTKVDKGSTVIYILSAGEETIAVPDVKNMYEGEATATLNNEGFEVTVDYESSKDVPNGCVISQSPAAGEKAKPDSTVNIKVSTGVQYYYAMAYVNDPSGGYVSPEGTQVPDGDSVTFSIVPNSGYRIASVSDSNGNSYGAASTVTISNVKGDLSISVTFEKEPTPTPSSSSASPPIG